MPNKSLYELTQDEIAAQAELGDAFIGEPNEDGLIPITPEGATKLEAFTKAQMASEEKIVSTIRVIHEMQHRANLADAEYKSMKEIVERAKKEATRCRNAVKRAEAAILEYMIDTDKKEILAGPHRLLVIECKGETKVRPDAQFSRWDDDLYTQVFKPDLNAIYERYKDSDEKPHGVEIVPGRRLKIG